MITLTDMYSEENKRLVDMEGVAGHEVVGEMRAGVGVSGCCPQ
jgi:hypothetical protein